MLADAIPLHQLQRVLVVKLRHHGDVLLTSPLFTALKAAAPHLEIDALVYADTAEMLTLHPDIAHVHGIDRKWKKLGPLAQLRAELGLLGSLRRRRYDLVIHLTEHWRGAWLARLLGARWAATYKVPGRNRFWQFSFSHHIRAPRRASGTPSKRTSTPCAASASSQRRHNAACAWLPARKPTPASRNCWPG
jgi:heptosyltransferase-3